MASRSWNRVELIGNLTRDPELRYTPNGAAVCTFGLATNRYHTTSDGERKEEADFHKLVAWNKLAEICNQYLKKGMKIFVSGRLQYKEWEPQEGQKRRDAEITLEDMMMLTPKAYSESTTGASEDFGAEPVKKEDSEIQRSKESKEPEDIEVEKKTKEPKESEEESKPGESKVTPKEEVEDDLPF